VASFEGKNCRCGGVNAYPSFADVNLTTTDRGRFALLGAAMYACFGIEGYIFQARRLVELEAQQRGEQKRGQSRLQASHQFLHPRQAETLTFVNPCW
jgi:hypothetical protein